ncbi:hypothetical protein BaRGS_00001410 [Batillaria attramentaria]|uniref:alpha-1,6-mannosyl-glycoprotein 6-beta-N-acetylglucosaminyltransferase n=1 Tax=Batillaria attramentaria TaxID=370345 RepID=A0ABD0M6W9_9CAEN
MPLSVAVVDVGSKNSFAAWTRWDIIHEIISESESDRAGTTPSSRQRPPIMGGGNLRGVRFFGRSLWRRMMALLLLCVIIWTITFLNVSFIYTSNHPRTPSTVLHEEIVQLSKEYVRALAKEDAGIVDGPYAGRFTAFDLKKTLAVLLESILARLDRLERHINRTTNGSFLLTMPTVATPEEHQIILSAQDLIGGKTEKCELTVEDKKLFPHCEGKIEWMRHMWKSDVCYAAHGVDGSDCSFMMYLSEVEGWCPRKGWAKSQAPKTFETPLYAEVTTDLQGLLELLVDPNERQGYAWIRMRITRLWHKWVKAVRNLTSTQDLTHRKKQKILVHLGLLSKQSGWKFAENQFKGGPLGELVQWSDLISVLYILGHQLTITSEVEQLVEILSVVPEAKTPCQSRKELPVTIIYTDIMGLIQFKKRTSSGFAKFSCLFRIVDSFGTEPAYNHRAFARQNKILSSWGGQDLNPRQFFTMFPHSPDNSFMGFVVEHHLNESIPEDHKRKDIALVYGKNEYMWEGKQAYLDVIKDHLEIHGTVYEDTTSSVHHLPPYVINHGILSGLELHKLLRQAKVFVGLGFPYEGPAPLEAVANGAVFLNPRFSPPHSSKTTKFFKGKPTQREVTSQHPYAEVFIGKPSVYTINISNLTEVRLSVQEILSQNTHTVVQWPPISAITFLLGKPGQSCSQACWSEDLICEPSHFLDINSVSALANHSVDCQSSGKSANIYYPSEEIVQLCKEYVRALAKEDAGVVDGPYAGRFTVFDLKKTLAVLLESILARLDRLERHIKTTNGSFLLSTPTIATPEEHQIILSAQGRSNNRSRGSAGIAGRPQRTTRVRLDLEAHYSPLAQMGESRAQPDIHTKSYTPKETEGLVP